MELNQLDKIPLANLTDHELQMLQQLEEKLNDRYYLIAFKKPDEDGF
ncbi:MAG: hypothetical protein GX755_08925 [Syntrophomonadaceae bacterium]|nr:hypothetical protein [Syntrophomonadaceae bacterium]